MHAGGDRKETEGFVSVLLELVDTAQPLRCRYQFAIINQADERANLSPSCSTIFTDAKGWGWHKFLSRADLLDETKGFSLNDTVIFEVKLTSAVPPQLPQHNPLKWQDRVLRANGELLESGGHSDSTLIAGGDEMRAHRAILAARSPIFKALLENAPLNSTVSIDDMDSAVFGELLRENCDNLLHSCNTDLSDLFTPAHCRNPHPLALALVQRRLCRR